MGFWEIACPLKQKFKKELREKKQKIKDKNTQRKKNLGGSKSEVLTDCLGQVSHPRIHFLKDAITDVRFQNIYIWVF